MRHIRDEGKLVLALSGRTKAGKSTVAGALAGTLGWPSASFGDYVREEARLRNEPAEREKLQQLGAELIVALGWRQFSRRALAHARLDGDSVPCILEGIRHLEALTTLRELFAPAPVYLIYLDISDHQRNRRLAAEGVSVGRAAAWERHSTERDTQGVLAAYADLVVPATEQPKSCVSTILNWLTLEASVKRN
jgi:dephospho-CoA kinase